MGVYTGKMALPIGKFSIFSPIQPPAQTEGWRGTTWPTHSETRRSSLQRKGSAAYCSVQPWVGEKKIGTAVGTIAEANRGVDAIVRGQIEATGRIARTTSAMAVAVAVGETGTEGGKGIEIVVESAGGTVATAGRGNR